MGGAKSVVLNSVLVFTFVALWHDLTFRLLAWGWLVSLFIIPELLASSVLPASKVSPFFSAFRPRPCPALFHSSNEFIWRVSHVHITHAFLQYDQRWWYRHVCALGAVGNMMMMMAANLVGFVIGTDGVQFFLQRLTGSIEGESYLEATACRHKIHTSTSCRHKIFGVFRVLHVCRGPPYVRVPVSSNCLLD